MIKSPHLHSYQIVFLTSALATIVTGPILYKLIDHGVGTAYFLSPEDRIKGVERLKANQTGVESDSKFDWRQTVELFSEVKTYVFLFQSVAVNMGVSPALLSLTLETHNSLSPSLALDMKNPLPLSFPELIIAETRTGLGRFGLRSSHPSWSGWVRRKDHYSTQREWFEGSLGLSAVELR